MSHTVTSVTQSRSKECKQLMSHYVASLFGPDQKNIQQVLSHYVSSVIRSRPIGHATDYVIFLDTNYSQTDNISLFLSLINLNAVTNHYRYVV